MPIIDWFVKHANHFIYVSLLLNIWYATVFALADDAGKCVYFVGAAILTIGLIMMR